jgi:ribosome maturation factor RimP
LGGIEIVKATSRRQGRGLELTLVIDRAGGVDMETCERISRRLNAALEHFTDPYTLSVQSAGLDRPLVRPADYQRFAGSNVKVTTSLAIGGAKTHRGKLAGLQGTNVVLARENGDLPIPLPLIKSANLEYDIRADLAKDKQERRRKHEH